MDVVWCQHVQGVMRKATGLRGGTIAFIAAVLSTAGFSEHADAASTATLYDFCSLGAPCKDGSGPQAAVVRDASGNLYGTMVGGGAYNHGAIYELTPNATRTSWSYTVLHSFCPPGSNVCVDGASPYGRLIVDASGDLYGTTPGGGARGGGTVFELSPNATRTAWTLRVLYNFGSQAHDPTNSRAGLVMDSSGRLYGTSAGGGTYGAGTVFQLTPNVTRTAWTEKVIYSFGANASDGNVPMAGLIIDKAGELYGTTYAGGLDRQGTVFALAPPSGGRTAWAESVLYDFCTQVKCADGAEPVASLLMDADGHLYGTTLRGGVVSPISSGCGTVFELTPNSGKIPWKESVLYPFCSKPVGADGEGPWAEVIMDRAGNLYGTTILGGARLVGSIFRLTPPAVGKTAWTETVLWNFCTDEQGVACYDGTTPYAGLIMDSSGNLYGTTEAGGFHFGGTVFEYP